SAQGHAGADSSSDVCTAACHRAGASGHACPGTPGTLGASAAIASVLDTAGVAGPAVPCSPYPLPVPGSGAALRAALGCLPTQESARSISTVARPAPVPLGLSSILGSLRNVRPQGCGCK